MASFTQLIESIQNKTVDGKDPKLEETELQELIGYLDSSNDKELTAVTETLGNLARNEDNRKLMSGISELFPKVVKLVHSQDEAIKTFAVRTLANLCFNHDENRTHIDEAHGVEPVVKELDTTNPKLLRVVCGCIANMCSTNEEISEKIANMGAVPKLMKFIVDNADEDIVPLAFRAITNMCEAENARLAVEKEGGLELFVKMLQGEEDDNTVDALSAVGVLFETKTICYRFIDKFNGLQLLLRLASAAEDEEVATGALEILAELSDKEEYRDLFLEHKLIPDLKTLMVSQEGAVKQLAAKVYAHLSLSDKIAPILYQDLDVVVNLLQHKDAEVQTFGCMVVGNIARTDTQVVGVVQRGIHEILLNLLKEPLTDIKVKHLAIGSLRNIAQTPQNKATLLQLGIMPPVTKMLTNPNAIVVYATIGCIKNLLTGGEEQIQAFIDAGGLDPITELTTIEENEHIKYESSRIVAYIANSKFGKELLTKEDGLNGILRLLKAKFPILINEGLTALVALLKVEETRAPISKFKDLTPILLSLVQPNMSLVQQNQDNIRDAAIALHLLALNSDAAHQLALDNGVALIKQAITANPDNKDLLDAFERVPTDVAPVERGEAPKEPSKIMEINANKN